MRRGERLGLRLRCVLAMVSTLLFFGCGGIAALHLAVWVWIAIGEGIALLHAWNADALTALGVFLGLWFCPDILKRWPAGLAFFRRIAGRNG